VEARLSRAREKKIGGEREPLTRVENRRRLYAFDARCSFAADKISRDARYRESRPAATLHRGSDFHRNRYTSEIPARILADEFASSCKISESQVRTGESEKRSMHAAQRLAITCSRQIDPISEIYIFIDAHLSLSYRLSRGFTRSCNAATRRFASSGRLSLKTRSRPSANGLSSDDNEPRAKDIVPETKNKTLLHRETSRHCPPSGRDPLVRYVSVTRIRLERAEKKPRGIR